MNRGWILLRIVNVCIFWFAISWASYSQSNNELLFNSTIDFINCKVAEVSLKDEKKGEAPNLVEFSKQFKCSTGINNSALADFLGKKKLDASVRLNTKVNEFKKEFSSALSKEELESLIKDNLLDAKLDEFRSNHKESFGAILPELTKYINSNLSQFDTTLVEPIITDSSLIEIADTLGSKTTTKTDDAETKPDIVLTDDADKRGSKGAGFWIWFVLGAVLGSFIYSVIQKYYGKNKDAEITKLSAAIEEMKLREDNKSKEFNSLLEENKLLKEEIETLKEENKKLAAEIHTLKEEMIPADGKVKDHHPEMGDVVKQVILPVTPPVFFMRTPHKDGFFNDTSKSSSFIPTESIYKFTLDADDESSARFQLVSDPDTMTRAIQTFSRYLEPVCDSNDAYNSKATRIVTQEPGLAVKQGDKWHVTKKALIQYE